MTKYGSIYRESLSHFITKRLLELMAAAFLLMTLLLAVPISRTFILGGGLVSLLFYVGFCCLTVIFFRNIFFSKRHKFLQQNSAYNSLRLLACFMLILFSSNIIGEFATLTAKSTESLSLLISNSISRIVFGVVCIIFFSVLCHWRLGRLKKYTLCGALFWLSLLSIAILHILLLQKLLERVY